VKRIFLWSALGLRLHGTVVEIIREVEQRTLELRGDDLIRFLLLILRPLSLHLSLLFSSPAPSRPLLLSWRWIAVVVAMVLVVRIGNVAQQALVVMERLAQRRIL
jgi:hypothetical protein